MATISFYTTNTNDLIPSESGLGFYGDSGFGASVAVSAYQGTTFMASPDGTTQGPATNNVKYLNAASGILPTASSGIGLKAVPNELTTLNVRFTHSASVKVQNAELRIYDRYSIANAASGVVTKAAEVIHPFGTIGKGGDGLQGSGDATWYSPGGSATTLPLAVSPGNGGEWAVNSASSGGRADTQHDWYVALSASPTSIGSKTKYGLYVSLEYL